MPKFIFDVSVDAWVRDIKIEAANYEEAEEKLLQMSLEELIDNGYVKSSDLSNIDVEVVEDEEDNYEEDETDSNYDDAFDQLIGDYKDDLDNLTIKGKN